MVNGGVIAHNGLSDWILQRATAVILVLYTLIFIVNLVVVELHGFASWKGLFESLDKSLSIAAAIPYLSRLGGDKRTMDGLHQTSDKNRLQIFPFFGC